MSSDVLPKFASLEKSRKTCEKKMESESDMMSSFSSVTNATSTRDDDEGEEEEGEGKISSKKLDFAERILKWEQLVTPNVNRLHYNRAIGVGKRNWRDVNEWSKSKANVKLCATEPFFDRSIVAHFSRDGGEVGGGERIGEGGGIKGRKGSGAEAEEVEKVEGEVSARRSAFAVEINDEREAVRKKLAAYHPHLLAQTSVRGGTEIASGHCYPTTTTIATAITTSSTPSTTALALPQSRSCCGNTSVSEHCSTTGSCDKTKRMILAAVEDASSSQSSDENSNSSRLRNVHAEINSTKNEDHRKEEEQREKVEEGDDDISVPIQLIRQSSEEGFNQVVKFKTRVARKGEAEDPKQQPKSSTHTEFNNEQGKLSSKKKKIPCAARRTSKGLANEGLDNRTTCVKQNSSGDIQFESEYCDPTEKTCRSTSANDDNGELKIFNCDAICAKSEGIRETTTNVDHSSQSMRKQQHQQRCDEAEISAVIGDPQTDDKSEIPTTAQKMKAYKPSQTQVILKKKRCHECFADAVFNAADSAIRQQQGLPDDNRTFIISEPQRRSVFATLSSFNKSKKLFLNKGKVTEESTTSHPTTTTTTTTATTATTTTTTTTNQGDLNASRGISTFAPTKMNENTLMVNLQAKPTTISSIGSGQLHDPIHLNNSSSILSQKRSKTLPRTDGAASNDKPEIVVNVPRSHSPHSTSNSSVSRGYPDDSSSVNNLHGAVEYKGGVNRRQNNNINEFRESLSSRLSRGFFEFTQGSSDRLQKWKNKLQNGRRHKDSSEPPTMNRKMLTAGQQQNGHLSNVEVALNWTMPQKCDSIDQIHNGKFPSTESASTPKGSQLNVALPVRSASDFFPISEHTVSNTTLNASETAMEHRTLKQRDHSGSRTVKNLAAHFQNLKNIQPTPQSIESYGNLSNNLPPPVRITPYSGVKPKGMNIIRPVAFRPYASCKSDKRQAVISSSSFSFYNSNKKKNDFLAKRLSNSDELKRSSQHSKDTVPNPSAPSSVNGNNRPRAIYQPSTSASFELASAVMAQRRSGKFEATENDYDVVPEYIERDKFYIDADSTVTENYSVAHPTPYSRNLTSETFHPATAIMQNSSISTGRDKPQQQNSNAAVSVAAGISSLNLVKKSPSSHQVYGSNTSSGSRHSSGIHVTPSPSDSGIADYETIIRDKENELTNVRATMEQNEEIVVKVYLEKERLWKEQLADLKQKLQASQQGENALREQIQRCNDEREQFQVTIQNLTSDKQGLQRKSLQLERELFQLRECFDELIRNRDETVCGSCRKRITCDVTVASTNSSAADKRVKPPLPTPRYSKESSSERELRSEVEELKNEVSTLRDKLNEQIGLFTNERKRWEEERVKFLNFNNSPSDRLGLLSTHDSPPADLNSQLSRDLKILSDGKSYIVSHDRLI